MNQKVDNALGGFEQPDPNESYWTSGSDIHLDPPPFQQKLKDGNGAHCPTCGRYAKIYRRRIHSNMARQLIALYSLTQPERFFEGKLVIRYAHTRQVRDKCGYSDFTLAKHWGLVQARPNEDDPSVKDTGLWTLTGQGLGFVLGTSTIPKYAYLFDDRLVGFSDDVVSIRDALGKKFNYQEIMESHHVKA